MHTGILKKSLWALLALAILCTLLAGLSTTAAAATETTTEKKSIAVYVIAGQSNAAGYSKWNQVNSDYVSAHTSFDNVTFYGRADTRYWTDFNTKVSFGLGIGTDRFGAEVGIAEKHMAAYPDQEALIIKYAVGGTYLTDVKNSTFTDKWGNWYPPSFADKYAQGDLSGKLYRGLIDTFRTAIEHYTALGYDIDFKGTFWMQGEAETDGNYAVGKGDYQSALSALIDDLRSDYAQILGDDTAKTSPFLIGKICPTFASATETAGVTAVRGIQNAVAAAKERVYLVETDDYVIVDPNGNNRNGFDKYHFEGNDMLALGQSVGDTFVTTGRPHVQIKVTGYGKADATHLFLDTEGEKKVSFTSTKEHYVIKTASYDGRDVLSEFEDGSFTFTDTQGAHELVVTFGQETRYALTTDINKEAVSVKFSPNSASYYKGTKVQVTVTAKDGYRLDGVTFNGASVTLNDKNAFTVTIVEGENVVKATAFANGVTPVPDTTPEAPTTPGSDGSTVTDPTPSTSESGCAGSDVGVGMMAPLSSLLLAAAAVAVVKKAKKREEA